ncbi:L-lactate permease [Macrococcus carouselicus]|uniref:L-lactate permease n=1 Tax=Macrococcus carouselicus TaxID=69969 RepID=UPI001FB60784|nr:L-lactate permease [Macrococcus carouselicus]
MQEIHMFVHSFDPFSNISLSALVAAVPILLFLLCLTLFRMKSIHAAILTLIVTLIITLGIFRLSLQVCYKALCLSL